MANSELSARQHERIAENHRPFVLTAGVAAFVGFRHGSSPRSFQLMTGAAKMCYRSCRNCFRTPRVIGTDSTKESRSLTA